MAEQGCPPALTPEGRHMQLVNMAYDLLEQRLRDGTATSQEVTTMIKYGSEKSRLELELMQAQRDLMDAKRDHINATIQNDEMFKEAMRAMGIYSGEDINNEENL